MSQWQLLRILRKIFFNARRNQSAQGRNLQELTWRTTWSSSRTPLKRRWFCTRWRRWRSRPLKRERSSRGRFKLGLLVLASSSDCWKRQRLLSTWKSSLISRDRLKKCKSNEKHGFIVVCFALLAFIHINQWIFLNQNLIILQYNTMNNQSTKTITNLNNKFELIFINKDPHSQSCFEHSKLWKPATSLCSLSDSGLSPATWSTSSSSCSLSTPPGKSIPYPFRPYCLCYCAGLFLKCISLSLVVCRCFMRLGMQCIKKMMSGSIAWFVIILNLSGRITAPLVESVFSTWTITARGSTTALASTTESSSSSFSSISQSASS